MMSKCLGLFVHFGEKAITAHKALRRLGCGQRKLAPLANGASATATIIVAPTAAGTISNTATVTGNEHDPDTTNNTATVETTVNPGPLDHVVVTPSSATLGIGTTQQFSATAYDQYNNIITGLTLTWSVKAGGGTIDSSGLFTAGTVAGIFTGTVKAETSHGAIVRSDVASIMVTAPPAVTGVSPDFGNQGETLDVTITGSNFTGATTVSFGSRITIKSFTVDSLTQLTANITIDANATTGARDVSVTTPGGAGTLTGGFTVEQAQEEAGGGLPLWVWGAIGAGGVLLFLIVLFRLIRKS